MAPPQPAASLLPMDMTSSSLSSSSSNAAATSSTSTTAPHATSFHQAPSKIPLPKPVKHFSTFHPDASPSTPVGTSNSNAPSNPVSSTLNPPPLPPPRLSSCSPLPTIGSTLHRPSFTPARQKFLLSTLGSPVPPPLPPTSPPKVVDPLLKSPSIITNSHSPDTSDRTTETNTQEPKSTSSESFSSGCELSQSTSTASLDPPIMESDICQLNDLIDYINNQLDSLNTAGEDRSIPFKQPSTLLLPSTCNSSSSSPDNRDEIDSCPSSPDRSNGLLLMACKSLSGQSLNTLHTNPLSSLGEDFSDNELLDRTGTESDDFLDEGIGNGSDQLVSFNHMSAWEMDQFRKIHHEGIFRRSGVKSRINLLFKESNGCISNNNSHVGDVSFHERGAATGDGGAPPAMGSLVSSPSSPQCKPVGENPLTSACVYDVADYFKSWFRNQDPLLPASLVASLVPLVVPDHNVDLNRLRAHLICFPNRLALETLLRFLSKFAANSEYNSMTATNLSIVWTPSICREDTLSSNINAADLMQNLSTFMKDARSVIDFLIRNVHLIFSVPKSDLMHLPQEIGSTLLDNEWGHLTYSSTRTIHASPFSIYSWIVTNRVSLDPLLVEVVDEGSCKKIKHSFSKFLPSCGPIRVRHEATNVSHLEKAIRIKELSTDPNRIYRCEWIITSINSNTKSQVAINMTLDLKGRPSCWYQHSFPKLLNLQLDRLQEEFSAGVHKVTARDNLFCCFLWRNAVSA